MDGDAERELQRQRTAATDMGGAVRIEKLHATGKLTARERLDLLLDPGTFVEIGQLAHSQHEDLRDRTPADGMLAGSGKIDGRIVYVTAEDRKSVV